MFVARKDPFEHPREFSLTDQSLGIRPRTEADGAADGADSAERRKGRRFPVSASAEMAEPRTNTQLMGRASDLGAGGCYVDTVTPFPVGTSLMLNLRSEDHAISTKAAVIYAHTGMGMGLAFTEMDEDQRRSLTAWLQELSGEARNQQAGGTRPGEVQEKSLEWSSAKSAAAAAALQELVSILRNKGILTETEADLLREKLGRDRSGGF
jgi:hypothetical protein